MEGQHLSKITIPDGVIGSIKRFKNFDPQRIQRYEMTSDEVIIFMTEEDRLQAMEEIRTRIEAYRYEIERQLRPETEAFHQFDYNQDFHEIIFTVDQQIFEEDISALMIELSVVEDALKYQLYSRKEVGVHVQYKDTKTNEFFEDRYYPTKNESN